MKRGIKSKQAIDWHLALLCLLIVSSTAIIGSYFQNGAESSQWYESIKPAITPPAYVFPIVWTTLYGMIAASLYFSWKGANGVQKRAVEFGYGVNLLANALWTFFFFNLRNPSLALVDMAIILASLSFMIKTSRKIDKKAFYLLIPYFIWVCFAALLNYLAI